MPASEGAESEGAAADAIRAAEVALARQNSVTAQVDLAVVTAVLNAHTTHTDGAAALESLQREIEAAVATRTALDTPAGAREFQRYLIDKLGDIRAVVEQTDLDDTSKASLAAALASLYASAGSGADAAGVPDAATTPVQPPRPAGSSTAPAVPSGALREPAPVPGSGWASGHGEGRGEGLGEPDLADFWPLSTTDSASVPGPQAGAAGAVPSAPAQLAGAPPPVAPAMPSAPAVPSFGGGLPGISPLDGLSSVPALAALADPFEPEVTPRDEAGDDSGAEPGEEEGGGEDPGPEEPEPEPAPPGVDGQEGRQSFAGVIAAAVAGVPIADAFDQHGITIPGPGTPVGASLPVHDVVPGDVALFDDRHALALGNGKVLLDDQIQPIETVNRPGFIGWQHPPEPDRTAEPDR